ncbi:hypothetical protein [Bacillus taeanensis]|uniref:hypothetical protein n=1 Tax=Bacillus taeanensis TaxID=273032 RepID=UPI0015F056DF|nr:hypothetical protein [Bacillus taeanensis]
MSPAVRLETAILWSRAMQATRFPTTGGKYLLLSVAFRSFTLFGSFDTDFK